ncbi:hypothetical protein CPB97_003343 [Podila verticillata]|nr:hypothetical protein CPB97_003343 [Podila verticillata]
MIDKVARDPTKYMDAIELKLALKCTVIHRASLGLPWSSPGERPILIESVFSRLRVATRHAPLDLIYAFHEKRLKQELILTPTAVNHQAYDGTQDQYPTV